MCFVQVDSFLIGGGEKPHSCLSCIELKLTTSVHVCSRRALSKLSPLNLLTLVVCGQCYGWPTRLVYPPSLTCFLRALVYLSCQITGGPLSGLADYKESGKSQGNFAFCGPQCLWPIQSPLVQLWSLLSHDWVHKEQGNLREAHTAPSAQVGGFYAHLCRQVLLSGLLLTQETKGCLNDTELMFCQRIYILKLANLLS